MAAVEQLVVDEAGAGAAEPGALFGELGIADRRRHFRAGEERRDIHAGEPGVGSEQFHVEGVVLAAGEDAGLLGVPAVGVLGRPGVFDGALDVGPVAS